MKLLHLFEAYGIELEYMVVDKKTLEISPLADRVLGAEGEVMNGSVSWANELAMHVVEMRNSLPSPDLLQSAKDFQMNVQKINQILEPTGAGLLPTAAHPWFDPAAAVLWSHECNEVYSAYDKVFGCKGHGWVNLQSTHLNLPFGNDEELKKLHTAIRVILPLLPALSASSPFIDGKETGMLDTRLRYYNTNQKKIPQISGHVIPERIASQAEYHEKILSPSFAAISPFDPQGILQKEWLNSRGMIARFDRMALEIRILDIQECPKMDIGIVALIVNVLKNLVNETWAELETQWSFSEVELAKLYQEVIVLGGEARINDGAYLEMFGCQEPISVREFWKHCFHRLKEPLQAFASEIQVILDQGCLSERILRAYRKQPDHNHLKTIYQDLRVCLEQGEIFRA